MIESLTFEGIFDRELDPSGFMSVGGFQLTLADGKTATFDFVTSYGWVNGTLYKVECCGLDNDYCKEIEDETDARSLTLEDVKNAKGFSDFYIYTGEGDSPEDTNYLAKLINPILCVIGFDDGTTVELSEKQLMTILQSQE